jgi:death on curing protein
VKYISLAEAYIIAEAVTGIGAETLIRVSRSDLLDSALHAAQAGSGDTDLFPSLTEKAAVLCVRIANNHPLPDGNKRLAWMTMIVFLELNEMSLQVDEDEAVNVMYAVAAREIDEKSLTQWIRQNIETAAADN